MTNLSGGVPGFLLKMVPNSDAVSLKWRTSYQREEFVCSSLLLNLSDIFINYSKTSFKPVDCIPQC